MSSAPAKRPITRLQGILAAGGLLGVLVIFALFAWAAEHFITGAVCIAYSHTWNWRYDWKGDAEIVGAVGGIFVGASASLIALGYFVKVKVLELQLDRVELLLEALWNVALVIGLIIGGWYVASHDRAIACSTSMSSESQHTKVAN
ncbi:MAG: hypothetical protein ACLQBA_16085 [Candidatus Binataceae bacterium]